MKYAKLNQYVNNSGSQGFLVMRLGLPGFFISIIFAAPYYFSTNGMIDYAQHMVGRDFVNLWTAAKMIGNDSAKEIFQPELFAAFQETLFFSDFPFHFWSYPPTALFIAIPFIGMNYFTAYIFWTISTLSLMLMAVRCLNKNLIATVVMLIAPSTMINIMLGQNGFFTSALIIAGFIALPSRPIVSGVLFGLLTFKPHLGLLIPIALIATRQWHAFSSAVMTSLLLAIASIVVFGIDSWWAFFQYTLPFQFDFMSKGTGPFMLMMPNWFMSLRLLGISVEYAAWFQLFVGTLTATAIYFVFRYGKDPGLVLSTFLVGTLIAAPQAFNYDMGLTSAAIILAYQAMPPYPPMIHRFFLFLLWLLPIAVIGFNKTGLPISPLIISIVFLLNWRAAMKGIVELTGSNPPRPTRSGPT